jgi:hypothetical protein
VVANEVITEPSVTMVEVTALGGEGPRPSWLRPVAAALVAYGIIELLVALVLLVVGLNAWPTLRTLSGQVAGSLHASSGTVGSAAAAAGGAQASLDQARQVTDAASQTAFQASTNVRQLGRTLDVQIFGSQPFADLAPRFVDTADNLLQLSTSLAGTSRALAQNGAQAAAVQNELTTTQQQLDQLARTVDTAVGGMGPPLLLLVGGTWVLLVLQALLALVAGALMLRR